MPTVIDLTEQSFKHGTKTTPAKLQAQRKFLEAVARGDSAQARNAFESIVGSTVDGAVSPGIVFLVDITSDLIPASDRGVLMEQPHIQWIEPESAPDSDQRKLPVYFVNGLNTKREEAAVEARHLASQLRRRVGLIYNPTRSPAEDWTEALMDRAWPATIASPLSLITGQGRFMQPNQTTRQVTHLLHHSSGNISIVSHSQGCLIVRNALVTASKMRGNDEPERWLRWVATGVPMRAEEIPVRPNKVTLLANKGDVVGQGLGLRLFTEADRDRGRGGHDFIKHYLWQIEPKMLW